jgi:hypothetical protein
MALFSPQARDTYVGVDMYIDGSWTRTYELRAEGDQVLETFFCRQRERKKNSFSLSPKYIFIVIPHWCLTSCNVGVSCRCDQKDKFDFFPKLSKNVNEPAPRNGKNGKS